MVFVTTMPPSPPLPDPPVEAPLPLFPLVALPPLPSELLLPSPLPLWLEVAPPEELLGSGPGWPPPVDPLPLAVAVEVVVTELFPLELTEEEPVWPVPPVEPPLPPVPLPPPAEPLLVTVTVVPLEDEGGVGLADAACVRANRAAGMMISFFMVILPNEAKLCGRSRSRLCTKPQRRAARAPKAKCFGASKSSSRLFG